MVCFCNLVASSKLGQLSLQNTISLLPLSITWGLKTSSLKYIFNIMVSQRGVISCALQRYSIFCNLPNIPPVNYHFSSKKPKPIKPEHPMTPRFTLIPPYPCYITNIQCGSPFIMADDVRDFGFDNIQQPCKHQCSYGCQYITNDTHTLIYYRNILLSFNMVLGLLCVKALISLMDSPLPISSISLEYCILYSKCSFLYPLGLPTIMYMY